MDITQIITVIAVIAVVYVFVKFIVSPLLRLITGIILFIAIVYILQTFFKFDFSGILGGWLDIDKVTNQFPWIGWIVSSIGNYINQAVSFIKLLLSGVPKT